MPSLLRTLFAATVLASHAVAQAPPPTGPHGIGFRVVHELDHSRSTGPRHDFEGREATGDLAYPVQVRIWYPATVAATAPRLTAGDYMSLTFTRGGVRPVTDTERASELEGLKNFARFGLGREISDAGVDAVYSRRMAAVRDAAPLSGRFPVIIAGTDGGTGTGTSIFESLASRGYVVVAGATGPALSAVQATSSARAVETRIRDLEFLVAHALQYPFVDPDRLGVMGINFDGMAAFLVQMKNMRGRAVVSIDGWEGKRQSIQTIRSSVHFDPLRLRVPWFAVMQDETNPPPSLLLDPEIFNLLKYGEGEYLVIRELGHAYLAGYGIDFPGTPVTQRLGYALLTSRVIGFLDRHVKGDGSAPLPAMDTLARIDGRHRALRPAPYAEEVERVVMGRRGAERLRDIYRAAIRENPEVSIFTAATLNLFAFRMSRSQRMPEALMLLELGVEAFPRSASALNDLGNMQLQGTDTVRAVQSFDRALAMLPRDTAFTDQTRPQFRAIIEQKIARLRPGSSER